MRSGHHEIVSSHTLGAFPSLIEHGFHARRPTPGPEWDLVYRFVESSLPCAPTGQARTIFIEPRLASGFPDIVAVYWHISTARTWLSQRANLTASDIRVLTYLSQHGPVENHALESTFPRGLHRSLERLRAARVIRQCREIWQALDLRRIFAVRRLIAIEAKIAEMRSGLGQALRNTWFASESYLLIGHTPLRNTFVNEAGEFGVGIVTSEQPLEQAMRAARREALPKSYASWLFNEWAWRASLKYDA